MICLQLEIDPLSGDIVCASETEAAILHGTITKAYSHYCLDQSMGTRRKPKFMEYFGLQIHIFN